MRQINKLFFNKLQHSNIFSSFHKILIYISSFFILISIHHCSSTGPFFENHKITMHIDTEVTEAWINLHIDGLEKKAIYTILRDDTYIFRSKLDKTDTLYFRPLFFFHLVF